MVRGQPLTTFRVSRYPEQMNALNTEPLEYEFGLRKAGYRHIVGLDEVGRGALAGPIAAAAVVLPADLRPQAELWSAIRDSKTLTPGRRTVLAAGIKTHALACEVAMIDVITIDAIGIAAANRMAMELALREVSRHIYPDFLLIDAMTIDVALPQIGIIDGDAKSLSIAAASIAAKVHRDSHMIQLSDDWPDYDWARNKGYGVASHISVLQAVGPCIHHRTTFRPVAACAHTRDE